jgi:molybdate transport system permease protein
VNWDAVLISLRLAGLTSLILLAVGLPLAFWLAYSGWRWKFLVESIVALPLVLPPTVLGFYILVATGPRSPAGRWYQDLTGSTLPFSFEGLVLGSVIYSLPFAVQPLTAAFSAIERDLIEVSWTLGKSRFSTFWRLIIPMSTRGLVTALVLTFAHTIGEFGVVLMVGGNIEGVTRTVSIDIYDQVQELNYVAAARTSLVLLIFSFTVLSGVYGLNRKTEIWPLIRKKQ